MTDFGWNYPAGAENDPLAPWNAAEIDLYCPECGDHDENADEGDTCSECEEGPLCEYEPFDPRDEPEYYEDR